MNRQDFSFSSPADGTVLHGTYIYPDSPKGVVQLLHGMAEHRERYFETMTALAKAGYATVIHDHRGHGDCPLLGHFGTAGAEGLLADALEVTRLAKEKFPALPVTLFGHSMGSLAARCLLKQQGTEWERGILCGAPYVAPAVIKAGQAFIALKLLLHPDTYRSNTVNGLVTGGFNKGMEKEGSPFQWLSYNPQNVAAYEADPLCGFCFTLSGFKGLMALMSKAYAPQKHTAPLPPVHFISGEEDPCHGGRFQTAVDTLRREGYGGTARLFPHMRHEILLETENHVVIQYILDILENNIQ